MNNFALINYDEKTLTLFFRWQTFTFDLNKGDIGEYWHGFETHDGEVYDVNFGEEYEEFNPSVCVYGTLVDDDGQLSIDTNNRTDIEIKVINGDRSSYFNYYVSESDIEFYAPELGSQTSGYHFRCYDGYGIADNGILEIKVKYPKISELSDKDKMDCLTYRYSTDAKDFEVHFGDVMMSKGKLESFKVL